MNIAPKIIVTTSLSLSLIASTSYGMDQLAIEGPLQTRPHLVDTSELDNPGLLATNKPALLEDARKQEGLATLTQGEFTEPTIDRRSMFHEAGSATTKFKYLSYKKEYGEIVGEPIITEKVFNHQHSSPKGWEHDDLAHRSLPYIETFIEVENERILVEAAKLLQNQSPYPHKLIETRDSVPVGEPWSDAEYTYQKMQHTEVWERSNIDNSRYETTIEDETLKTAIPKPMPQPPVVTPQPQVNTNNRNGVEGFCNQGFWVVMHK